MELERPSAIPMLTVAVISGFSISSEGRALVSLSGKA
jgi:hypothetical protein